jgi:Uma2 family endonuclease
LETGYRPDREYIDGDLLERNLGETDHSRLQMLLAAHLFALERRLGITVLPEQRVQVAASRFRVPDIAVVLGPLPTTRVLLEPPFLCVEILSRDDSMYDMQDRIDDYLNFGVAHVWVVNPRTRRAFVYTVEGMREAKDGVLRTESPEIRISLAGLE